MAQLPTHHLTRWTERMTYETMLRLWGITKSMNSVLWCVTSMFSIFPVINGNITKTNKPNPKSTNRTVYPTPTLSLALALALWERMFQVTRNAKKKWEVRNGGPIRTSKPKAPTPPTRMPIMCLLGFVIESLL